MLVDYHELIQNVRGTVVPKPVSGTLSGHAAGEPFDKHVYEIIKRQFPKHTFRQFEYLNHLYSGNLEVTSLEGRVKLFKSPSVHLLLGRGKDVTQKWNTNNLFDEKQNDTADILVVQDDFFEIIDIKTRNISKSAQAPNIISAFKLAQVCKKMIESNDFKNFTINYFELDWELVDQQLICRDAHFACLFKAKPENLYINWAAAMQIQFHVSDLDQSYNGTLEDWARLYLVHFVTQVNVRSEYMINEFAKPFEMDQLTFR